MTHDITEHAYCGQSAILVYFKIVICAAAMWLSRDDLQLSMFSKEEQLLLCGRVGQSEKKYVLSVLLSKGALFVDSLPS